MYGWQPAAWFHATSDRGRGAQGRKSDRGAQKLPQMHDEAPLERQSDIPLQQQNFYAFLVCFS